MRVLVAMSGGVDSSVAAGLMLAEGHDVVGVTMKLWGGAQDSGCCSVGDVDDARRVAQQLGIAHHVFNFSEDFEASVVAPYVEAHADGRTPNPCIECNRHLKFDRLLSRSRQLGFDALATGHHARVLGRADHRELHRGTDRAKDQSYVLYMLGQRELARVLLPVGEMTKADVRSKAAALGLRTAAKAESQDTCFIAATGGGRGMFVGQRTPLHPGRLVDAATGADVGEVAAVELVTVGQRRGLGTGPGGTRRYAVGVDVAGRTVTVGSLDALACSGIAVQDWRWVGDPVPVGAAVVVQTSAHGAPVAGRRSDAGVESLPQRRVAPGQAVVLYDAARPTRVLGGGIADFEAT